MKFFMFVIVSSLLLVMQSCLITHNNKTEDTIKGMYGKEINLLLDGVEESVLYHPKIVIYVDTADCSVCRVRNLILWQDLIKEYRAINQNIDLVFIINPKPENEIEVEAVIHELGLENACLDKEQVFSKQNSFLPADKRFHTLLLDKNNIIKVVGSPMNNKDLDILYRDMISNLK